MKDKKFLHILIFLTWVFLLAFFFAQVEIQIEGAHGWAAGLPTWRIEKHWLLDMFWGGRPMTGYHAWVFSFMLIAFLFPIVSGGRFSRRLTARCMGGLMLFWIMEDLLWFVLNPAFGLGKLTPRFVPWHHHWFLSLPVDYFLFLGIGALLVGYSFREKPFNLKPQWLARRRRDTEKS